jgi:long-chain fatty acid transport protein
MVSPLPRKTLMDIRKWPINFQGWIIGLTAMLIFPGASVAGNAIEGAKAAAMGAFAAVADDPSAIAHNPAGIINLKGTNLYNGISMVNVHSEYESPEGRSQTTAFQLFFPPHIYLTSDLGFKNLAFGLGIYSPFGIGGRKWSDTGLTRYASTEGLIATININPTVAWRVLPQLSLGAGLDILWASNEMAQMVNQSLFAFQDARLSFKGAGFGVGGNFGILLFPEGKLSLAFTYRSRIRVKQRGTLALEAITPPLQPFFGGGVFRTNASVVMEFPHIFTWGAAYRPTSRLTLSLEADWYRWSVLSRTALNLETQIPAARFTNISLVFNWKDALLIMAGMDYKISDRFSIRGGYIYQQTSVPDFTLNPGNPDSDQHFIAVGLGYRPGKWVIDAFYAIGFYVDRQVDNAILSGTYNSLNNLGGVSIGYRF